MIAGGTSRSPGQEGALEQRQSGAQQKMHLPLLSVLPHGLPPAFLSLTQASLPEVCTRGDSHKAPTTSNSSASCQVSWQEGLLPFHFFGPFFPPHLHSKSPESICSMPRLQSHACLSVSPAGPVPQPHMCLCPSSRSMKVFCPPGVAHSLLLGTMSNFFHLPGRAP